MCGKARGFHLRGNILHNAHLKQEKLLMSNGTFRRGVGKFIDIDAVKCASSGF